MTLEHGEVRFYYRPRVGIEDVRSLGDVQRFFLVFVAELREGRSRYRRLIVGRKRLPDPRTHEREWAFVAEVSESLDDIRDDIESKRYETKTRGVRVLLEARPAGVGAYRIFEHEGHTHLAYVLASPQDSGEVRSLFNISDEASYIVVVLNPEVPAPPSLGLRRSQQAQLPRSVLERFRGRRFIPLDPGLLDHKGVEIVLIGASEDAGRELGIEFDEQTAG